MVAPEPTPVRRQVAKLAPFEASDLAAWLAHQASRGSCVLAEMTPAGLRFADGDGKVWGEPQGTVRELPARPRVPRQGLRMLWRRS